MVSRETKLSALFIACALLSSSLLTSCGSKKYSDEEIKSALEELIPASYELNEIYFGEGLPVSGDTEDIQKFYDSFDVDVDSLNYYPVSDDCPYQTEEDLKNATALVFTDDYCEYLYELAFNGISATFNEDDDDTRYTETSQYAKYIEQDGVLTVRLDIADEAYELNREYLIDEFSVVSQADEVVKVSIPTVINGVRDVDVSLTLKMTDNGFRLDSPTY